MCNGYIGILGLKGHGKTTIAKILQACGIGCRVSFAQPIKDIIKDVFDLSYADIDRMKLARETPPGWQMDMRKALQHLGTEGFRAICPTVWTNFLFRRYDDYLAHNPGRCVIIDDVRFIDELMRVKESGGFMIGVYCPSKHVEDDPHPSETYMRDIITRHVKQPNNPNNWDGTFNSLIVNPGDSFTQFEASVRDIIVPMIKQHFKFR